MALYLTAFEFSVMCEHVRESHHCIFIINFIVVMVLNKKIHLF